MSLQITLPKTPRTGKRGRPLEQNSLRTSVAMAKLRLLQDMSFQAIADKYNEDKRFQASKPRHFSPQAVQGRIERLAQNFPEVYAQILGAIPEAVEQTVEAVTV